jgi:formamidopyrimidine-DNA glycosylase
MCHVGTLTVPELPEVETLRRGLAACITGMTITAAGIGDRKIFGGPEDALRWDVVGRQISRVARRGKVLILFLRESGSVAGESGSLLIHPQDDRPARPDERRRDRVRRRLPRPTDSRRAGITPG